MPVEITQTDLDSTAAALAQAGRESLSIHGATESDLRHRLFLVLGKFALDTLRLPAADVRQEGTRATGRFDSLFGRAVLEYKQPRLLDSPAERRNAADQAVRYLEDKSIGAHVVIITDGSTWGILRDPDAGPEPGEQAWLDLGLDDSSLSAEQRFIWRPNSEDACRRVLTLITTVRSAPVTAASVIDRLGPGRPETQRLIRHLAERLRTRKADSRTDLLFTQWISVAGVAYGIKAPESPWPRERSTLLGHVDRLLANLSYAEAIFVLHTYVSLSCKFLACELLALRAGRQELRPTQWPTLGRAELLGNLRQLEDGHLTEQLSAPGLLAGDLFGWYLPLLSDDEQLARGVIDVIEALAELAWARVANAGGITLDILRDFYQSLVPSGLRKALGEFFTPRWVAERVLEGC